MYDGDPGLGKPKHVTEWTHSCGYVGDVEGEGAEEALLKTENRCGQPPAFHGVRYCRNGVLSGMCCCARHVEAMAEHADWVHPWDWDTCPVPESVFNSRENRCEIPDWNDGLHELSAIEMEVTREA